MEEDKKLPVEEEVNQSLVSEFWDFLKERKRYWLLPIIIVLVLLSALIIFTEGAGTMSPFVYTLF